MSWRELPLTANQLRENGLAVISVWSPSQNVVPQSVCVRWQRQPEPHEIALAEHFIIAKTSATSGRSQRRRGAPGPLITPPKIPA